ncbi:MAG TPA: hypothetical protein VK797_17120 [Tepidisphaeraceae bacterium]|jgi:hypothetical protein|nr:hypothetical protein [Tepidisphaeraceae bacterium]
MKLFSMIALLAGALLATSGCATPGYTATENGRIAERNMNYDLLQMTDDWNYLWLYDKPSRSTTWTVQ